MAQNARAAFTSSAALSTFLCGAVGLSRSALSLSQFGFPVATTPLRVKARARVSMVSTDKTKQQTRTKTAGNKAESGRQPRARREKKASQSAALLAALEKYEPVIGIEVHVQLSTKTKAYCSCSTRSGRTPNTNICPVCMGHPGSLPVLNKKSVQLAAQAAMALNCIVSPASRFDRKNYYYADTAKNYQITQQHAPIAEHGHLMLAAANKKVGITRLHMEEDSAKLSHEGSKGASGRLSESTHSLIDFNRAGVPLIEIVSEPDIRSGAEAAEYGQELQRILRYIRASDCNMQDGSLRCDVNISIRAKGESELGTKVELKNLNSFGSVQKSIEFEIERQANLLDKDGHVIQETRTWDEKENVTKSMRVKEGAADYRYFPEPDLPPLQLSQEVLGAWRKELPELPAEKRLRFESNLGLSPYDAFLLADDVTTANYFDETVAAGADPKKAANWIMGDMTKVLKTEKLSIAECKLMPNDLAEMINLIDDGIINGKIAKDILPEVVVKGGSPATIVRERYVMGCLVRLLFCVGLFSCFVFVESQLFATFLLDVFFYGLLD
jgi:aspartyl-tRNA(Asn)/glutamyl-tRNA(Gln) amidotransferase subunit B